MASSATVWLPPLVKLGTSLTAVTVIVNVWSAPWLSPPFEVPPLSARLTVTVAEPLAFAAGVYVRVPFAAIAGWVLNSALLSFRRASRLGALVGRAGDDPGGPAAGGLGAYVLRSVWSTPFVRRGIVDRGDRDMTVPVSVPPLPSLIV
jgi:hypothetical protein